MTTLRHEPPRRWRWILWTLPNRASRRGKIEEYQAAGEREISVGRRHPIVLTPTVVICSAIVIGGLATHIGAAVIPSAALFLVWRVWRWRAAQFVLTDRRLLFVDGIGYMRVDGLLLKRVLDVALHRSIAGRIFGYGDIAITLRGEPGQLMLRKVSRPDAFYFWILSLTAVRDATEPES